MGLEDVAAMGDVELCRRFEATLARRASPSMAVEAELARRVERDRGWAVVGVGIYTFENGRLRRNAAGPSRRAW